MNNFLQEIICCPDCRGNLEFQNNSIKCLKCSVKFKIDENIPLMFSNKKTSNSSMKEYLECYEKISKDDIKNPFEDLTTKRKRHRSLKKFIGNTKNKKILDIGAAQGFFLKMLEGQRVAFDISVDYLKLAQKSGLISVAGLAEALPFKNEVFDIVVCADILEHVIQPKEVLREAFRVLVPGGKLFLEVPYKEDLSIYKIYNGKYKFTHLRSFDEKILFELLSSCGFTISRQSFCLHKLPKLPFKIGSIFKYLPEKIQALFLQPLFIQIEAKK